MKNKYKRCNGERTVNIKKECKNCMKLTSRTNFARHRLPCWASEEKLSETNKSSAVKQHIREV